MAWGSTTPASGRRPVLRVRGPLWRVLRGQSWTAVKAGVTCPPGAAAAGQRSAVMQRCGSRCGKSRRAGGRSAREGVPRADAAAPAGPCALRRGWRSSRLPTASPAPPEPRVLRPQRRGLGTGPLAPSSVPGAQCRPSRQVLHQRQVCPLGKRRGHATEHPGRGDSRAPLPSDPITSLPHSPWSPQRRPGHAQGQPPRRVTGPP